jgi:hypothetical protein
MEEDIDRVLNLIFDIAEERKLMLTLDPETRQLLEKITTALMKLFDKFPNKTDD